MPNVVCNFVTHAGPGHGSSLYYVTAHWVIRCSGNTTGGRSAETFIRQRAIEYVTNNGTSGIPTVGSFPREGAHDGNAIVVLLAGISRNNPPAEWIAANGVPWTTAVDEIDAAIEYAQRTQSPRASRRVGAANFLPD